MDTGQTMPDGRPAIPADVCRQVLYESGHKCAVCGAECPLERAHIIPWSRAKDHCLENLLCLCANCHARADGEKWGEATLKQYKLNPWVHRRKSVAGNVVRGISLTIKRDYASFGPREQDELRYALAGFLRIPVEDINITDIRPGSVRLTVSLPSEAAGRLLAALEAHDTSLEQALASVGSVAWPDHEPRLSTESDSSESQVLEIERRARGLSALVRHGPEVGVLASTALEPRAFDSDQILISTARTGDTEALNVLGERLRVVPRFLATLNEQYGHVLTSHEVEDVVQDTILHLWSVLREHGSTKAPLETWVYGLCRHAMLAAVRRRRRSVKFDVEEVPAPAAGSTHDTEMVYRALQSLSPVEADVVRFKHFEVMTFEDIATRIGETKDSVRRRYYRALERLKLAISKRKEA